ncbi:hypothetical protein niasHS_010449 [Heterodera schachtii]|uniref:Uncharacterized protein n=1 Tax=Heterodera schachtii TaxID=97005 RepID=A0ABD2J5A7_HETSC
MVNVTDGQDRWLLLSLHNDYGRFGIPSPDSFHSEFNQFHFVPRPIGGADVYVEASLSMFKSLGFIDRYRIRRQTLARFLLMVQKGTEAAVSLLSRSSMSNGTRMSLWGHCHSTTIKHLNQQKHRLHPQQLQQLPHQQSTIIFKSVPITPPTPKITPWPWHSTNTKNNTLVMAIDRERVDAGGGHCADYLVLLLPSKMFSLCPRNWTSNTQKAHERGAAEGARVGVEQAR